MSQTSDSIHERIAALEGQVVQLQRELATHQQQFECVRHLVAHDLKAPLRSIDGFSRILNEDFAGQLGEEGSHHLERIHRNVSVMNRLLEDALAFLRPLPVAAPRTPVNLSLVAGQVAQRIRLLYPSHQVTLSIADNVSGCAVRDLCEDLMYYLFDNAWKFTSEREDARVEFGSKTNGSETQYFVKDNGTGFDMRHVEKIFQPFQRLHSAPQFPGNGIGLTLAQRIVHHHCGRIWAEASVDTGTAIYFTLGSQS